MRCFKSRVGFKRAMAQRAQRIAALVEDKKQWNKCQKSKQRTANNQPPDAPADVPVADESKKRVTAEDVPKINSYERLLQRLRGDQQK
jgi:hypothetical protein